MDITGLRIDWNLEMIVQIIAAASALGTAAFGLVDVSKVVRFGLPSVGFAHLKRTFKRFDHTLQRAVSSDDWRTLINTFWISGVALADQKAKLRALVRLGLSSDPDIVRELAAVGGVEQKRLREVALKLESGDPLDERDLNLMGRVDTSVIALIDAAYDRADYEYRNAARASAAVVSVLLGIGGGLLVFGADQRVWLAAAVGLVAVPLAPIAKDLSSSLSAAVRVATSLKGG